jgi:type I restriction enzyme S subunit
MSNNGVDSVKGGQEQGAVHAPKLRFPEFRDAGDWEFKTLNELLSEPKKRNRNQQYGPEDVLSVSGEHGCVNQIELMGRSYAGASVKDYHIVETGDVVYTKSPLKVAPYGIIKANKGRSGIVSTLYAVYRPTKNTRADYIDHYFSRDFNLNSYLQPIVRKGAKNDMKVNNSDVLTGSVWAPKIKEQEKISDCLSSIDALIMAEAERVEMLKEHKKGLLQQLFPQKGASTPRTRFPEFRSAGDWKQATLGDLGKLVSGLTYDPSDVRQDGLLVLRSSNIQDGQIDLNDCVYVVPDVTGANPIQVNDILVCVRNGSASLIGKNALIPDGMPPCTHGAFMTVFRSKAAKFVFQLFQTEAYQRQVAADLGATINSINGAQFLKYKFLMPKLAEQERIADFLSTADATIAERKNKLADLRRHKQGLLQSLFLPANEVQE